MSKPVTIRFVGDETKFRATTEAVGGRLKGFGKQVDDASEKTSRYSERMGGLSERTDNSERNLIGLHDVIDGTAAIMAGPGEAGIAAYVQGWADLAGGVTPLIETIKGMTRETISNAVATGRAAAATVRKTVVETIAAVKTKALAVAQAALNVVMSANPIMLVVIAIAALVAGLVIAYKRSETFRNIVQAAFRGVQAAFRAVTEAASATFGWIRERWPLLVGILTGPIGAAVLLIVRNFDRIRNLARQMFEVGRRIVQSLIDGIRSMVGAVGDAIAGIAGFIRDHLPFSPAKVGPLSGSGSPYLAGQNIARMLGQGLQAGRSGVGGPMGSLLAPAAVLGRSGGAGGLSITVHARTNADAAEIAREVAWAMRTSGR